MKIRPLIATAAAFLLLLPNPVMSQNLGPVRSYMDLVQATDLAEEGDTVLVYGKVQADETSPLTSSSHIHITSAPEQEASVAGLHLVDAKLTFSNIDLVDSLIIEGTSNVMLSSNVNVYGGERAAIDFSGNGELIVDQSCSITASDGHEGISIAHDGGNLYAALEGTVTGGDGIVGGAGLTVCPLQNDGLLLVGGNIIGGNGEDIGGNAVNLYDISGNAYISITGVMQGGDGVIGGDGMQHGAYKIYE